MTVHSSQIHTPGITQNQTETKGIQSHTVKTANNNGHGAGDTAITVTKQTKVKKMKMKKYLKNHHRKKGGAH